MPLKKRNLLNQNANKAALEEIKQNYIRTRKEAESPMKVPGMLPVKPYFTT